ncbi:MAG: prepilin-type N-terminal cleavage/methylation domain-containing protein [Magnetococcales bacterium]|nr:prepilin-type N-terminal cleavage/methylation domain-containing protein [Magnetococcales bacterium]
MNKFRRMLGNKNPEKGFSLVELAIVLVIIGLIVSAISVGRNTMRKGESMKAFQQFINPWIQSALQKYQNTGSGGFGSTGGLNVGPYNYGGGTIAKTSSEYDDDGLLVITFTKASVRVDADEELQGTITNALESARELTYTAGADSTIVVTFEVPGVNQTSGSEPTFEEAAAE